MGLSITGGALYTGSVLATARVLLVDCQATAACPRGHLLELGWATLDPDRDSVDARSRVIALPAGQRVPPQVARITGIDNDLARAGVPASQAWAELLADASSIAQRPPPAVAHFARFERPFLARLADGAIPLDLFCTHEIAIRLFPDLPRRSLRALAGYFGRSVGELRRSAEHVVATAFVWRELVLLLEERGVRTWQELRAWLEAPSSSGRRTKRGWPMPREVRLAAPDRPGLYRMLRTSGDVLYVGKAASLHARVNSYFRKLRGVHERTLEMLSQARGLSFEITESPLEAALLEPDEIKRHRPPYNEALTEADRAVWFARTDLSARGTSASAALPLGPFASTALLDRLDAFVRGAPTAIAPARWAPEPGVFEAAIASLRRAHPELEGGVDHRNVLRVGARLWREGRRLGHEGDEQGPRSSRSDRDEPLFARAWTPEAVAAELEQIALGCARAARRARWLTALVESTLVWSEPGAQAPRLLVISDGEIARRESVAFGFEPPAPAAHRRARAERHAAFTVARFDRLRVLTTELKRLVSKDLPVAVRLAPGAILTGARLAGVLARV